MRIEDRDYIVGLIDKVERSLRYYAGSVDRAKNRFAEEGRPEELGYLLNEILWALPNLGIQTVISSMIREMDQQAEARARGEQP